MSMAKLKRGASTSTKSTGVLAGAAETSTEGVPVLSESSFTNLRDKISAHLQTVEQKARVKTDKPRKGQSEKETQSRGKKRTADGVVVQTQQHNGPASSRSAGNQIDENDSEGELRQALKELGGTQEDLDLIAGADSDSELEGLEGDLVEKHPSKRKTTSLQDGMSNILKEIALAQGDYAEHTSSSEEEEDEEDEEEEESLEEDKNASQTKIQAKQTTKPAPGEAASSKKPSNSRLKCESRADWFNIASPSIHLKKGPIFTASSQTIEKVHNHAKTLLDVENEAFKNTQQSSSSQAFYNTVVASGTLSDKISALTLAVQESPLHNVKALEALIGLASKRSRAQAIDVLRALKDLFAQGALLPGDRRLVSFAAQPALLAGLGQVQAWKQGDKLPKGLEESDLICWAFEDWLKQQYFEILKILEVWCNDEIEFAKGRAVSFVYELLKEKPEQESNLLRLLVSKLGDPVKKIASQASYLLMQLLLNHPAMKMIVVSAIETDFIFRPGQSLRGQYYAAVTINQTALSSREEEVAQKLLDIYFGLFTALLKPANQEQSVPEVVESQSRAQRQRKKKQLVADNPQGEELREKLISAVLTGVNRAYPYVGADGKNFADHLETLFKITHSANFNTSVQAMLLVQQLTSTHSAASERFYRTLYESLLDPRLITASKQQLYLNLLHRSLKADMNIKRIKAFVKRLLQTLSLHDTSFVCAVFFLLRDLEQTYPSLTTLVDQPEDHENDEEVFRDVDDEEEGAQIGTQQTPLESQSTMTTYDAHKRDPLHANADNACAWELLPFLGHFHPSVTVSADNFLQHTKLPGKPDLTLHTLIHFLDRFVYRNPKLASNKLRGSSIMQPTVASDTHAVLISSASRSSILSVNTDEFRNKKGGDIAADDAFFHKYFTTLGKETKSKDKTRKDRGRDADDDESIGDEGEDEVWKAMIDSAPDLEGGASDDEADDLDMSDFEDEMAGSDADDLDVDMDDDSEVDVEPGIFDDSDDEVATGQDQDDGSAIEDLDSASASDEDDEVSQEEKEEQEELTAKAKARKERTKAEKERKKKLKALPTFASAADYAKMLDDDDDEDLG